MLASRDWTDFGKCVVLLSLFLAPVVGVSDASAQTPVCSNTPAPGERIECKKDATSTDNIEIITENVNIETTTNAPAIYAEHFGDGTNTILVIGSKLTASVDFTEAIQNAQYGTGGNSNTYIIDSTITTTGQYGFGVFNIIQQESLVGNIILHGEDLRITTTGVQEYRAYGFGLYARNQADEGDIRVAAHKYTYNGTGHGIHGWRDVSGHGAVTIFVSDSMITTTGTYGKGFLSRGLSSHGISAWNLSENGTADDVVDVDVFRTTLTTKDMRSHGVKALSHGPGEISVYLEDVTVNTESTETNHQFDTRAHGVFAGNYIRDGDNNGGNIKVETRRGEITTRGTESFGMYGCHGASYDCYEHNLKDQVLGFENSNTGDISIKTTGTDVTTHGPRSAGILVEHTGDGLIDIHIEDGSVLAKGMDAHAIQVGPRQQRRRTGACRGFGRGRLPQADGHGERPGARRYGPGGGRLSRGRRQSLHRATGKCRRRVRNRDSGDGRHTDCRRGRSVHKAQVAR